MNKNKENEKVNSQIGLSDSRLSAASFNALKFFYKLGAQCCFTKALYQECVHAIFEALKFNPDDAELWCLYGKVFVMKKSYDYARPLVRRALAINPKYREAREILELINK
jgi:tetratricopeptide (TPR) repeat protein